ncbi:MAG: hypothetical protein QM785_06685 [Pyrinomonadaceae bacterium]
MLLTVFAYHTNAQYCGGSIRTIRLEYPKGSTPARSVNYQLFYLMPKHKADRGWEKHQEFISEFLYGSPKKFVSWRRSDDTTFIEVPKDKAEAYINGYKLEDFKYLYEDAWHKWEPDQMVGKFDEGILKLRTGETNDTTFIMRVTARSYEPQYLLGDFMGGCHSENAKDGKVGQKIIMKPRIGRR